MVYELLINVIFLCVSGLLIRSSLVLSGQSWANTYHHLATYILLPNIAYVITTIIAGNIALSLGMIGALSIVRFRNPVKNPFELTIFFGLLTLGIAAGVDLKYAIVLTLIIIFTCFGIKILQKIFQFRNYSLYQLSFSEGEPKNIIEIESSQEIHYIENNKNLASSFYFKETNTWEYKLMFENRKELNEFENKINLNSNIISKRKFINT